MKSPNLFILTFILFIKDLNYSVNCEKQNTASTQINKEMITQEDVRASSNVSNQTRKYLSGSPSNQTKMYSSDIESDTPNLPDQGLEVVSVTKELNHNTTITSDEHLTNESSVTKEISKNLLNQNKLSKQVSNDKQQQTSKKKPLSVPLNSTVKLTNSTIKKVDECSKAQIDYLILSLIWPVSICSKRACILNSPQRWFIHNLSPLFHIQDNNQISKCCSKRPFNASEIGSLITTELKVRLIFE